MTNAELDAIEARAKELWDKGAPIMALKTLAEDVPALVAEVRRLRPATLRRCNICYRPKQTGSYGVCYECTYP